VLKLQSGSASVTQLAGEHELSESQDKVDDTIVLVGAIVGASVEEEETSHPGGHGPIESSGGHALPSLSFPAAHSPAASVGVLVLALVSGQFSSSTGIRPI
jgi:hypothetical protein